MARPNERSIDTNGDMECDTSIFHVWFCSDTAIDDDDTDFMEKEEFADEAIEWLKLVYERIQNSLRLVWTNYGARPRMPSTSNPSTNGLRQLTEEGKMDVKAGAQERHTDWLQKVNMEKKNWDQSEKTQEVKDEPSKSLNQMPEKTVTFDDVLHTHHLQTVGAGLPEPKSYIQNLNSSSNDRVNKTQPETDHTLLKQIEASQIGASTHTLEQLGATGRNPQSQAILNHAQRGATSGY